MSMGVGIGMGKHRHPHLLQLGAVIAAIAALTACGSPGAETNTPAEAPNRSAPPATHHPAPARHQSAVAPPCASVRCVVDNTFPGATVSYGPHHPGAAGPRTLDIRLPPSVKPPSGSAAEKGFVSDDTGWRAGLAFAAARALDPRIGAFQLTYANGTAPPGADGNGYHGGVPALPAGARPTPMPKLDSISLELALRQMRSNLHVLDRALGPDAVTGQQVHVVALDLGRRRFGLDVTVELRNRSALRHHLGDLIDGLATGLGVGAPSLVEGLGITATVDGRPLAGAWDSARLMSGGVDVADGINYPGDNGSLARFPDLTGGPEGTLSAPGA